MTDEEAGGPVPSREKLMAVATDLGDKLRNGNAIGVVVIKTPEHRPLTVFVPRELDNIRPAIVRHIDAMIFKLRKNAHKGSMTAWDLQEAFEKLEGEVKELRQAIDEGSPIEIMMEGADVSNMALILVAIGLQKINHA